MKTHPQILSLLLLASQSLALSFTISNGQIFTPGFAILDAPQPGTPLGGDTIEVALDVSANGKLKLPPYGADSPSQIHNISIFMYSYDTGRNFTITNGTATGGGATLGDIMMSEPGSTVKHVKWHWPECLVGDGQPKSSDSNRGAYNVDLDTAELPPERKGSLHHLRRANISHEQDRLHRSQPPCDSVNNPLLTPEEIDATSANTVGILFAPGDATQIEQTQTGVTGQNGLGGGLGSPSWSRTASWLAATCLFFMVFT
ncbi:hypothetical protein PG995_002510 [Apiospora arundinis]